VGGALRGTTPLFSRALGAARARGAADSDAADAAAGLGSNDVDAFLDALRTARDRAMVQAMLLGALRRSEVLGISLEDVRVGERRLLIAEG